MASREAGAAAAVPEAREAAGWARAHRSRVSLPVGRGHAPGPPGGGQTGTGLGDQRQEGARGGRGAGKARQTAQPPRAAPPAPLQSRAAGERSRDPEGRSAARRRSRPLGRLPTLGRRWRPRVENTCARPRSPPRNYGSGLGRWHLHVMKAARGFLGVAACGPFSTKIEVSGYKRASSTSKVATGLWKDPFSERIPESLA